MTGYKPKSGEFPSPESGIINSFVKHKHLLCVLLWFPSPESGIINSFRDDGRGIPQERRFRPLSRGLSIPSLRHHYIFSLRTDKFAICKQRGLPEFSKKFHLPAAANCLILRAKTTKHGLLA